MDPGEPLNHTQIQAQSLPLFDLPEEIPRFSFPHKPFQVICLFIAKVCSVGSSVSIHLSISVML